MSTVDGNLTFSLMRIMDAFFKPFIPKEEVNYMYMYMYMYMYIKDHCTIVHYMYVTLLVHVYKRHTKIDSG